MNRSPDTPDGTSARVEAQLAALKSLFAAWRAAAVYDEHNQGYQARRAELVAALQAVFQIDGEFAVVHQNDYFFVNGQLPAVTTQGNIQVSFFDEIANLAQEFFGLDLELKDYL